MLPADLRLGRLSRLRGGMPTSAPLTLKTSLRGVKQLRGLSLATRKVLWAARQVHPVGHGHLLQVPLTEGRQSSRQQLYAWGLGKGKAAECSTSWA